MARECTRQALEAAIRVALRRHQSAHGALPRRQGVDDAATLVDWDGENRLLTITQPGGAITTCTYDAGGLRRSKQAAGGTTKFVWDGQDMLAETDANGTTQAACTQSPDTYGALVSQRRSGASSFYDFDARGSTMELTDAAEPAHTSEGRDGLREPAHDLRV